MEYSKFGLSSSKEKVGPQSARGPKGDKGDIGRPGPVGPKGDKGDAGPQGVSGSKGDKGDRGQKGDKGDAGPQGSAGTKGDKGEKGDEGDIGLKGERGISLSTVSLAEDNGVIRLIIYLDNGGGFATDPIDLKPIIKANLPTHITNIVNVTDDKNRLITKVFKSDGTIDTLYSDRGSNDLRPPDSEQVSRRRPPVEFDDSASNTKSKFFDF